MCGACGRTVVADPALGPVRRTRDLLVVAQLVNDVTAGLPGAPTVRVSGDSFVLAGRTGTSTPCATVEGLWHALHDGAGMSAPLCRRIAGRLAQLPPSSALEERVLALGLRLIQSN